MNTQTGSIFGSTSKRLAPTRARYWKLRVPTSLQAAFDECLSYALEAHNRSAERVAELMGMPSKWALYKWISEIRMPANMLQPFEHACGIDLVSRYFAAATGKLLISVPTGKPSTPDDIAGLQSDAAAAITALINFYQGQQSAEFTRAALLQAMQQFGWHESNVAKHAQPELDFDQ